jgi:hypothetical protein
MIDPLLLLFIAVVVTTGGLGAIAIASPRRLWLKALALAFVAATLATSYAAYTELLSRPKPAHLELLYRATQDVEVLAFMLDEGEAIFVWVLIPGVPEPRAYRLPWSLETAQELNQAARTAAERGTALMMRSLAEPSLEDREQPLFYPAPQQPSPPKE